jgi:hypothetical protein
MEPNMPLLRYFLYVGGALLSLLLLANVALPPLPPGDGIASGSELPVIRIKSDRKGPEAVVLDTSRPPVAPVVVAKADSAAPAPAAEFPPKARVREAFAQFVPPAAPAAKTLVAPETKTAEHKPLQKHKVAKARVNRPLMLVAQQPQSPHFGLFTW